MIKEKKEKYHLMKLIILYILIGKIAVKRKRIKISLKKNKDKKKRRNKRQQEIKRKKKALRI